VMDATTVATSVYTLAVALGYIFPAILGALAVTTEFRHRTITPTLLAEPRRSLVLGSKLVAVLPFALVVALAGVIGTVLGGAATLGLLGEPTLLGDSTVQGIIVRQVLALVLWAMVGVGFGSVLTNQVAAIVVLLAFTQFVEPILRLVANVWEWSASLGRFLPGSATDALVGSGILSSMSALDPSVPSASVDALLWWQGGLVLAALVTVLLLTASLTTLRRDVE